MQKFVIHQNIQHFEDLLEAAVAPEDRQRLQAMLDAERAKLLALDHSELDDDRLPDPGQPRTQAERP